MSRNTPLYGQYTNIGPGARQSTGGHHDSGRPGSLGGHDGGGNGLSGGGGGNPYTTPYIGGNARQGPNDRASLGGGGDGGSGPPSLSTFSNPRGTKVFSCKPDATVFPTLKSNAQFQLWYIEVIATARAQGFAEVFIPEYTPDQSDPYAVLDWQAKQAFGYMVLMNKVQTVSGKRIVLDHKLSGDAQAAMMDIIFECEHSNHAILDSREIIQKLSNLRFNPSRPSLPYVVFFENLVEKYNGQQTDRAAQLTDPLIKSMLQIAIQPVKALNEVTNREGDGIATGGRPYTFSEFLAIVKTTASMDDKRFKNHRSVKLHEIEDVDSISSDVGDMNLEDGLEINETQRRPLGATMNKETWNSISGEGKKKWDALDASDKAKILSYAKKRGERSSIEANQHEIDEGEAEDEPEGTMEPTDPSEDAIEVNQTLAGARGEAHAADPRRMLGNDKPAKPNRDVNTVSWTVNTVDRMVDEYLQPDFHKGD
jgi:hypothetical protein